ncbi:MAG: glycine cleavage system protein GcvH [Planctomycetes bacterium]|nr:glycine cleavage system protein GcvH [Planctomycetota bacterium]
MARPEDIKYAETHEWVRPTKKGEATVGITDYAVKQLSDLVHIELPKVGTAVEQGNPFGEIESVKTVADLVSPITGKIVEVNPKVAEDLDILKAQPYGDGWLIKIKPTEPNELNSLMNSKEYDEFIESSEEDEEETEGEEGVDEDELV